MQFNQARQKFPQSPASGRARRLSPGVSGRVSLYRYSRPCPLRLRQRGQGRRPAAQRGRFSSTSAVEPPSPINRRGSRPIPHQCFLLALEDLPRHLIIIGGKLAASNSRRCPGGLEASDCHRESSPPDLSRRHDVSTAIRTILESEGVAVRTDSHCVRLESRKGDLVVRLTARPVPGKSRMGITVRRGATAGRPANLDATAARLARPRAWLHLVDHQLRTTPGIWASAIAMDAGHSLTPLTMTTR